MFAKLKNILIPTLALATLPVLALADAGTIPRLAPGPHMGFIEGFDDLRPRGDGVNRAQIAEKLRDRAIAAGMTIGRAQIDWRDLETGPGRYDQQALTDTLEHAGRGGVGVFVTFSTIDTEEATLPAYLTGQNGLPIGNGGFSGPRVTKRFHAFLDWFIPQLKDHNVWGLALGNEVDAPMSDGLINPADVARHYTNAIAHAKTLDPDLALTVTLSGNAWRTQPGFTAEVVKAFDIVAFNHYCLNQSLRFAGPHEWQSQLAAWKRVAGDKQIFIQELGCPVGYGNSGDGVLADKRGKINGSFQRQKQFFAFHAKAFAEDPQLRAATVFQLFDWSPELAGIYNASFKAEGLPAVGRRLEEWLATSGMCRWSDGGCRPGWRAWLAGLQTLEQARKSACH